MKGFFVKHKFLLIFSASAFFFLLAINRWFWPTPDEYLYASVARSIIAGVRGEICLSCFNTEHTYLVSTIVAAYQWLFHVGDFDLVSARVPVFLFSVGTLAMIWLIAREVVEKPEERPWLIWLFLLLPGYFVLSTHFMLDVPLTFGFALLIYLLIKRSRAIWISLALLLILLIKDYGFYFAFILALVGLIFDFMQSGDSLKEKIKGFIKDFIIIFSPSVFAIFFLLAFDILPYPRLLESGLMQYFGDFYLGFAKSMSFLFEKSAYTLKVASQSVPVTIDFGHKAISTPFTGEFPTAIFQSPTTPEITGGFFNKLWLIYKYNFSEQDVMVFMLPLFATGLLLRLKVLWQDRKKLLTYRTDLIFLVFIGLFAFLNWHEALNIHGFRVTVPVVIGLVYFGYFGARALLLEHDVFARKIFTLFFAASILLYIAFIIDIKGYGSVIATNTIVSLLLQYKLYIFLVIFIAGYAYIMRFVSLHWRYKTPILLAAMVGLFFLKFLPFYLESRAATKLYGFDYGLQKVPPFAQKFNLAGTPVAMNVNQYVARYYFKQLKLPTTDNFPQMRVFKQEYPGYFAWFRSLNDFNPNFIVQYEPRFIFFLNKDKDKNYLNEVDQVLAPYAHYIALIEESYSDSGYVQWRLYAFDRDGFFKDYVRLKQ